MIHIDDLRKPADPEVWKGQVTYYFGDWGYVEIWRTITYKATEVGATDVDVEYSSDGPMENVKELTQQIKDAVYLDLPGHLHIRDVYQL